MSIAKNLQEIRQDIENLALRYGRSPNEITLVAVTKGHTSEEIQALYDAGQRLFGESRQQEAAMKMEKAPSDISWHFIGTLQKNKVRKVIGKFNLIHAVDSPELAAVISRCSLETGLNTQILLQVNTSGEASKHGLNSDQWRKHLDEIMQLPAISIQGLMTMAPADCNEIQARQYFETLRLFRDELKLHHLSMGMSHDYPWAIAEGATLLRIGSKLFGAGI